MARGRADYAGTTPVEGVWGVTDLGEISARLGAGSTWERRGAVVWQDWFEHGLQPWWYYAGGSGSGVYAKLGKAYRGDLSAHLIAGSDADQIADIRTTLPVVAYAKMGFEVILAPISNWEYWWLTVSIYNGTRQYASMLRYYASDNSLCIYTTGGAEIVLATGLKALFAEDIWHYCKLVVDFDTHKYVRVIYEDTQYDVSDYDLWDIAATATLRSTFYVGVNGNAGVNGTIKVGQVVLTRNEP